MSSFASIQSPPRLWITPPAKDANEYQNFLDLGNQPQWPKAFSLYSVFKFYIVNLAPTHPTFIGSSGVEKLKTFSKITSAQGKKIAVELGAVYAESCTDGPYYEDGLPKIAQRAIDFEGGLLQDLKNSNVPLDYIVMDGPLIRIFDSSMSQCVQKYGGRMSLEFVTAEVIKSMKAFRSVYPQVQFVYLNNFPNWNFRSTASINGVGTRIRDGSGQILPAERALEEMVMTARNSQIPLSGVQIDNPYNFLIYSNGTRASGPISDAEKEQRWERLNQFIQEVHSYGLPVGLILNSETDPSSTASEEFSRLTTEYASEINRHGIQVEDDIVQSWYDVPQYILPENLPSSYTHLLVDLSSILSFKSPEGWTTTTTTTTPAPTLTSTTSSTSTTTSLPVTTTTAPPSSGASSNSLSHLIYRLFNANLRDYLSSLSISEGSPQWQLVGGAFELFDSPSSADFALYRCRSVYDGHHFDSTSSNCEGQMREEILGYLSSLSISRAPRALYRCYSATENRHLSTNSQSECSSAGMTVEGILGYTK